MRTSSPNLFLIIFILSCHVIAHASDPPHMKLIGVWAYGNNVTDSLTLDHKQNNLRFFCGTQESFPIDSLTFRFKLEGYDSDWITPFKEGWYFYTDLPPGDYNFIAQGRFKDGQWSQPLKYSFTILTPLWRTWWAYTIYISIISISLCYIIYISRSKIKLHNQLAIEHENQRFRTQLVMHATREFRTPLTIISTTIERLKGTSDEHLTRTDLQHLRNSSRTLMKMLEQLVEFREIGSTIPYAGNDDIIEMTDIPINNDTLIVIATAVHQLADVMKRDIMRFMQAIVVNDGTSLLKIAENSCPDAIIMDTDINDDAYEILHYLKNNPATSRIPIILISDFDNKRSLLRAIRSDADDYMTKPFNCEVLTALVMKKIKIYRENDTTETTETTRLQQTPFFEKRTDKLFLEQLDKTIEANIADPDFDINTLAYMLRISRTQLYNKVKALRGLTPVEYLRDSRLAKAASLLNDSLISVKEVRCQVGMPDATNFNRRFKEKYGVPPSVYR